jgi:hypothetical protein
MKFIVNHKMTLLLLLLLPLFLQVKAQKTGVFQSSMTFGGKNHILAYSVPDTYNPANKYPLVVGLHGCPEAAIDLRNALKNLSTQYGAIVVCPDNSGNQITDGNFVLRSIDSTRSVYNIDTTMVFLTGFSCGGQSTLNLGLYGLYKFRGIFPWDPYAGSVNLSTYDKEIPVVLAFGNNDGHYSTDLMLFDSLKANNSTVHIVVAQGVAHEIPGKFDEYIFKSFRYLLDSNNISMSAVNPVFMDSKSTGLKVPVRNIKDKQNHQLEVTAYSTQPSVIGDPVVTYSAGSDSAIITLVPGNNIKRSSTLRIIVEAKETDGTGIEQTVFEVNVKVKPIYPVNASSQSSFVTGPENVVDNISTTKWMSQKLDNQWLCIDLCRNIMVKGLLINWSQQATEYTIKSSLDSIDWKEVYSNTSGKGGKDNISFEPILSRYLELDCIKRASNAFSIYEIQADTGQFAGIESFTMNKQHGKLSLFPNVLSNEDRFTTITYSLQNPMHVNLSIYSVEGQKIETIVNQYQLAGNYSLNYELKTKRGNPLNAGIYLVVISTPEFRDQKKMMMIR